MPPMTMSLPPSVVIESEPPISEPTLVTRPSEIGCAPRKRVVPAEALIAAGVAEDQLLPAPALTVSPSLAAAIDVPRDVGRAGDLAVDDQLAVLARDDDVVAGAGRDRVVAAVIGVDRPIRSISVGSKSSPASAPPRSFAAQSIEPASPRTMLLP